MSSDGPNTKVRRGLVPGNRSLHDSIMREAAVCSRMKPKPDREAAAIERELRRWDGVLTQEDFQASIPDIAARAAAAVRRVRKRQEKARG